MIKKLIKNNKEVRDKILSGLDLIAKPVVQTLSPKGGNVLYEDSVGNFNFTNDGVSIAKEVSSDDPVEDAVIKVVKHAALKTNAVAGDGTTTTILLADTIIRDGFKLLDEGYNPMELKDILNDFALSIKQKIKPITIDNDEQLFNIAKISSNNDDAIAKDILKVVKTAGETGLVFINPAKKAETEIIEDTGFIIEQGMLAQEFANADAFSAQYEDVHVLVTDKRLYYEEEAEAILRTAIENGIKNLVVVARDFIGKSTNVFVANHNRGVINLLLVKHPDVTDSVNTPLADLAIYLGGKLVTEKNGKLVDKLTQEDFIVAKKVYANAARTVLVSANPFTPALQDLIKSVREEYEKDRDNEEISKRLAVLTTGMVTVNVAGATPMEVREKMFRYEDAINATRSAMRDGYVVGGGLALYNAFTEMDYKVELRPMFRRYCEASIRQIAKNCGEPEKLVLNEIAMSHKGVGYNAKTGMFEDLLAAGVIDPYKVTEMAIDNSISVANALLTSNYIIVNDKQEQDGK